MMTFTGDLIDPALDYAVAVTQGCQDYVPSTGKILVPGIYGYYPELLCFLDFQECWNTPGPILDSINGLEIKCWLESSPHGKYEAHIHNYKGDWVAFGPTLLVAALRVYVMSELGEEVEIPNSLLEQP